MKIRRKNVVTLSVLSGLVGALGLYGCAGKEASLADINPQARGAGERMVPETGQWKRVGGDMDIAVTGSDGNYRTKSCSVTTPLPEGYPAPTPPGAIDIKSYPIVRRAEVDGKGDPDDGMNGTFWPLFNHIKKHDIAMTSPVEMDYPDGMGEWDDNSKWTMSFLYRSQELNDPGQEGSVRVRDAKPLVVAAIGVKGTYTTDRMKKGKVALEAWLKDNPQWKVVGSPRVLHYNGPSLTFWNKWSEVQIPVAPAGLSAIDAN
ncbi:MAG: heme-binding protein [Phycisphaerales bacterium]